MPQILASPFINKRDSCHKYPDLAEARNPITTN